MALAIQGCSRDAFNFAYPGWDTTNHDAVTFASCRLFTLQSSTKEPSNSMYQLRKPFLTIENCPST